MTCCICSTMTPQDVLDEMERDVFGEAMESSGTTSEYSGAYAEALWNAYRERMIGSVNLERWERLVGDRIAQIAPMYDVLMSAYADADLEDPSDGRLETITDRTAIEGTDGDVVRTESETFPIAPVDPGERYLTSATTTKTAPNTRDKSTTTSYGGLTVTTLRQMMDDIDSPLMRFADEFDDFFINRWMI